MTRSCVWVKSQHLHKSMLHHDPDQQAVISVSGRKQNTFTNSA